MRNEALFIILKFHRLQRVPPQTRKSVISYPVVGRKNLSNIQENPGNQGNMSGYFLSAFSKRLKWLCKQRTILAFITSRCIIIMMSLSGFLSPHPTRILCISGPIMHRFDMNLRTTTFLPPPDAQECFFSLPESRQWHHSPFTQFSDCCGKR